MRIFWHEKHTESHIRNRKNPKNATKHNELSMHTKINISMVLIKIIPKIKGSKSPKPIQFRIPGPGPLPPRGVFETAGRAKNLRTS